VDTGACFWRTGRADRTACSLLRSLDSLRAGPSSLPRSWAKSYVGLHVPALGWWPRSSASPSTCRPPVGWLLRPACAAGPGSLPASRPLAHGPLTRNGPRAPAPAPCAWCGKFFLKRIKKIKFKKEVPDTKNSKNGYFPPVDRAGGMGPGTSRPSNGREVPKLFAGPS
jgi:hypothetical protein